MSYKPKYCCQCAVKIERVVRRFWASPRFCELCETEYGISDWLRRGAFAVLIIISIIGIGNFWRKPEKELTISANQLSGNLPDRAKNSTITTNSNANTNLPESLNKQILAENKAAAQPKANPAFSAASIVREKIAPAALPLAAAPPDVVYFCGARTKKGTPCSRRVKTAGRCWQHAGQPAMLPPEKLIAER